MINRSSFTLWWVLGVSLWLSACSTLPSITSNQLDRWQVRGKLSVITPEDSHSGYLTWQQDQDHYDIYIAGPFGAGGSRLQGNTKQASLLLNGWRKPQISNHPEQLIQTYLGWNLPLKDIRYWIQGQSSPSANAAVAYDTQGHLAEISQQGWQIKLMRYQQQQGQWRPSLIKITGHDYRLTLAISEWTFYEH